jgi:hypothetical protein
MTVHSNDKLLMASEHILLHATIILYNGQEMNMVIRVQRFADERAIIESTKDSAGLSIDTTVRRMSFIELERVKRHVYFVNFDGKNKPCIADAIALCLSL